MGQEGDGVTAEGWRDVIIDAVRKVDTGDGSSIELLAKSLEELDRAKQRLHNAGFGVTGTNILRSVDEVLEYAHRSA